jgi:REP element-mobilizing transposase RayT
MVHYLNWDDNEQPLAYLVTFRTYGTWLHGDERLSVDRHKGKNLYGTPRIAPNADLTKIMGDMRASDEFLLDGRCREVVDSAIRNVCEFRKYLLHASNVRTNHCHTVVTAAVKPDAIINAFKSNATRELREAGLADKEQQVWSRGGSTRYLWKPFHLERAIDYVLYGQGNDLPDFV